SWLKALTSRYRTTARQREPARERPPRGARYGSIRGHPSRTYRRQAAVPTRTEQEADDLPIVCLMGTATLASPPTARSSPKARIEGLTLLTPIVDSALVRNGVELAALHLADLRGAPRRRLRRIGALFCRRRI